MNGRLYDAVVGRMLSPDNYVQDPTNSQNYNRYSYCLNNPLKYTDPSGWKAVGPSTDDSWASENNGQTGYIGGTGSMGWANLTTGSPLMNNFGSTMASAMFLAPSQQYYVNSVTGNYMYGSQVIDRNQYISRTAGYKNKKNESALQNMANAFAAAADDVGTTNFDIQRAKLVNGEMLLEVWHKSTKNGEGYTIGDNFSASSMELISYGIVEDADNVNNALGAGLDVVVGMWGYAQKESLKNIGKQFAPLAKDAAFLKAFKYVYRAGVISSYIGVAVDGYKFLEHPTTGSFLKLAWGVGVVWSGPIGGIADGLFDASGYKDKLFNGIDNVLVTDKVKK